MYQVANVKSEWNCIKTLPDLSGTGTISPPPSYLCLYKKLHHGSVIIWEIILYLEFENIHTDVSISGKVSSVKFGPDAKYIAVGSMDRNLRIFGLPGEDGDETES